MNQGKVTGTFWGVFEEPGDGSPPACLSHCLCGARHNSQGAAVRCLGRIISGKTPIFGPWGARLTVTK